MNNEGLFYDLVKSCKEDMLNFMSATTEYQTFDALDSYTYVKTCHHHYRHSSIQAAVFLSGRGAALFAFASSTKRLVRSISAGVKGADPYLLGVISLYAPRKEIRNHSPSNYRHSQECRNTAEDQGDNTSSREARRKRRYRQIFACQIEDIVLVSSRIALIRHTGSFAGVVMLLGNRLCFAEGGGILDEGSDETCGEMPFDMTVEAVGRKCVSANV
jgi:hypothetical protein